MGTRIVHAACISAVCALYNLERAAQTRLTRSAARTPRASHDGRCCAWGREIGGEMRAPALLGQHCDRPQPPVRPAWAHDMHTKVVDSGSSAMALWAGCRTGSTGICCRKPAAWGPAPPSITVGSRCPLSLAPSPNGSRAPPPARSGIPRVQEEYPPGVEASWNARSRAVVRFAMRLTETVSPWRLMSNSWSRAAVQSASANGDGGAPENAYARSVVLEDVTLCTAVPTVRFHRKFSQ